MASIKLYFAGEGKDVPFKPVISRSVIRAVEGPIAVLRDAGQNASLSRELANSPNAAKLITYTGGVNSTFANEERQRILEAYPNLSEDKIQEHIITTVRARMLEEFPEIWKAVNNPTTEFPLDNEAAVNASIEIVKAIIDTKNLTEQEKALMLVDTFWDEQDLVEVADAVRRFRDATKL